MQRVKEPIVDELQHCLRCKQDYCLDCVEFHLVESTFQELINENTPFERIISYKGTFVCPWCFNQIIDKLENEVIICQECKSKNISTDRDGGCGCNNCSHTIS